MNMEIANAILIALYAGSFLVVMCDSVVITVDRFRRGEDTPLRIWIPPAIFIAGLVFTLNV